MYLSCKFAPTSQSMHNNQHTLKSIPFNTSLFLHSSLCWNSTDMKLHVAVYLLFKTYAHSKRQPVALHYRNAYWQTLTPQERRIHQQHIPWVSLSSVKHSLWWKVFMSRAYRAFITLSGFTLKPLNTFCKNLLLSMMLTLLLWTLLDILFVKSVVPLGHASWDLQTA